MEEKGLFESSLKFDSLIENVKKGLVTVDQICEQKTEYHLNQMIPVEMLNKIGDLLNTDWSIMAGIDFGDPYAVKSSARSILAITAKGLIGSRDDPLKYMSSEASPKYFYLLLYLYNIAGHSLPETKDALEEVHGEYDGLDKVSSERFGSGDLEIWCEDRTIEFEPTYPSYGRQKEGFKEFYLSVQDGRFKAPIILVPGYKEEDLFREEMAKLQHVTKPGVNSGWFGSPEKENKNGVQDDSMYAIMWSIYGGIKYNPSDFRRREG